MKNTRSRSLPAALASTAIALVLGTQPLAAQDAGGWTFTVAPYLWGAGLSGSTSTVPGGPPVNFDLSFSDILSNLDMAGMVAMNAQNGRIGFTVDLQYVRTSVDGTTPGPLFARSNLTATTKTFSLLGDYQIVDQGDTVAWVSAGARYWSVDSTLTLSGGILAPRSVSFGDDWWDPMVGIRGKTPLGARTYATGWAYIGGFGVGSDFMADVFAGIGYKFSDMTSLVGGWRYQKVDRTDGTFLWDVVQSGPIVGLSLTF